MNEHTTPSILQRVPVILAVTAASYGLPGQPKGQTPHARPRHGVSSTATGSQREYSARDVAAPSH